MMKQIKDRYEVNERVHELRDKSRIILSPAERNKEQSRNRWS